MARTSTVYRLPSTVRSALRRGLVIPAHPLALTRARKLDERRQRALTRYYLAAGAGGIAVGVHTTQFAIRDVGLYRPVLELAAQTVRAGRAGRARRAGRAGRAVLIAGICGGTRQAVREAAIAADLGYHAGLLSLGALPRASTARLLAHARAVAEVIPLFGFYLQPAVGGRPLDEDFWRRFAEIDNVVAIKIAPFNRYATLDVVRGVAASGRAREIALYTGNDDSILVDLLTSFDLATRKTRRTRKTRETRNTRKTRKTRRTRDELRMVGGLLGHWAFWTRSAVEQHAACRALARSSQAVPASMLRLAAQVTDSNAAVFDAANGFAGCIPGIHEMLRRQGLLAGRTCLDPHEELSRGQMAEIDRVCAAYPHLNDDAFVAEHLGAWLG